MSNLRHSIRRDIAKNEAIPAELETFTEKDDEDFADGLGSRWKFWRRRRYIVVIMLFFGDFMKVLLRSNLSIAVLAMTDNHTVIVENGTEIQVRDFDWDVKTRGLLLSIYFYGYIATNIPGGILALKYGGGKLYGYGIILTSVTTLFTPFATRIHLYLLMAIRIIEGLFEGVLDPCKELLMSNWFPVNERSSSVAFTTTGNYWGHAVGVAISSTIGFHCGWEAIFYFSGGVGVLWFIAWLILVKEYPRVDKSILPCELRYIENYCGRSQSLKIQVSAIPYLKIVTSMPVWAIIFAHTAFSWGLMISHTHYPVFVNDVVKLDYENSGYLSSLPFFVGLLATYIMAPLADLLFTKNLLTPTSVRKIFICGSFTIMATFGLLIQLSFSFIWVVVCLTILQIFSMSVIVHLQTNILDIAPKYSSILGGLTTTTLSLCGIVTPTVTAYLTQNKTAKEWQLVFSILSGLYLLAAIVYGIFASGQLQPWAAEGNTFTSGEDGGLHVSAS